MPLIADTLTDAQSAELAALPTRRETHEKREALLDCHGHRGWKGERCGPCADCGLIFTESGLRLRRGACERMLCRRCLALAKKGEPHA